MHYEKEKAVKRNRYIIILCILVASVVFLLGFYSDAFGRRVRYFDANNGMIRVESLRFWRVYKVEKVETKYSRLLKEVLPRGGAERWEIADIEEKGIRRLFFPQNLSFAYGRIASDSEMFAILMASDDLDSGWKKKYTTEFYNLVRVGDSDRVRKYLLETITLLRQDRSGFELK